MSYDENIYAKIVSGEITQEEIDQLKTTGEWEEIQMILQATEDLSVAPLNKEAGFEALLKKRENRPAKKGIIKWLIPLASAAAVGLLLIGFFYFNSDSSQLMVARNGEIKKLMIDESVNVTLNDGSSVKYNNIESKSTRTIQLNGEAFFDVVPGNSVIIETENGKVEVLGTQFNVRSWGKQLSVECFNGRVKVVSKNGQTELTKMESVRTNKGTLEPKTSIQHTNSIWLNAESRIKQEPLTEVFKEMERQYNITIKTPLLDRIFSGGFPHNDLKKALDDVCLPMGLTYKIINADLVEIYE